MFWFENKPSGNPGQNSCCVSTYEMLNHFFPLVLTINKGLLSTNRICDWMKSTFWQIELWTGVPICKRRQQWHLIFLFARFRLLWIQNSKRHFRSGFELKKFSWLFKSCTNVCTYVVG
jgi:hypothetical protein